MGKLLMLREEDHVRIARLKRDLKARSKADVVRRGLDLLEKESAAEARIARRRRAARLVRASSEEFLNEVMKVPRTWLD